MDSSENRPVTRSLRVYVFSVVFLAAVVAGTLWVVKTHKRPGQMTLIESQGMDMTAMKAPVGSVPVALEVLERGHFEAAVSYAGSVVPYTEQEIIPRAEGYIAEMLVYPGDSVWRGQLLARLESPDVQQRTAAAEDEAVAASGNADAMSDEAARMRQMVDSSQAEVDSMRAELDFREAEFGRMQSLYSRGAVSKSELDQERAMLAAAAANVKRAEAEFAASGKNLSGARRQQSAMRMMADASARRASAAKTSATWLVLTSPIDGVVTERLAAPGTLARLGSPVLRLAEISRVRLQANISMADASRVAVGNRVEVTSPRHPGREFGAKLTAVFPSSDPTTRTITVEAVTDNPGRRFLPGDYISMKIITVSENDALSVPDRAVLRWGDSGKPAVWVAVDESKPGEKLYTCVMHPEVISKKPGNCPKCGMKLVPKKTSGSLTAHLTEVETGVSSGDRVQILGGLSEGGAVVVDGIENLVEGSVLFATGWGPGGPKEMPPPPAMEGDPSGHDMGAMKKSSPAATMEDMPGMSNMKSGGTVMKPAAKKSVRKKESNDMYYTCPMHPEVHSDKPGKCPKCGMDLVEKR